MRIRAGVILISDNKIALIKRVRDGRTYYIIPGGGLDEREYIEDAAIREAQEELGISVSVERLLFIAERLEHEQVMHLQMYFLAKHIDGVFASGDGEEFHRPTERGTYEAVWMPLDELKQHNSYPTVVTDYIHEHGIPEEIVYLREEYNYPSNYPSQNPISTDQID